MATPDRRAPSGEDLARKLLGCEDAVPFDDLAERADVAEVAAWLGTAVEEGLVEDIPGGDGRRRFRLRGRGKRVLTLARRQSDAA